MYKRLVRDAAADSMVLLENKNGYLPISEKKVNLFGWGSTEYGFLLTGGGSGGTSITNSKEYKLDPDDAFEEDGFTINRDLYKAYTNFSTFDADYRSNGSTNAYVTESLKNPGASFYTPERMLDARTFSNVAVAFISRWGAENVNNSSSDELKNVGSYSNGTFLELTTEEKIMFAALQTYGFHVIVVLNVCNNIELGFIEEYSCIEACIFAGIPGQTGAIAIPQIISGKVNPSGRISDTLPYDNQTNNPTYLNAAKSSGNIAYQEGIYFGYKWYETADAEGFFNNVDNKYGKGYAGVVQYPYGYGLSYTTFAWETNFSDVRDTLEKTGEYYVRVKVTNTGTKPGKEVVQLYGHTEYINGGLEKPERIMLDFAKTKELTPGESDTVTLSFSSYDLASYDDIGNNGYRLESGNVLISVQSDAHNTTDAKYSSKQCKVAGNINYSEDPVTDNEVTNRFTGTNAYANMPIDGSTVYTGEKAFKYLSRKNHFENYSQLKQISATSNKSAVDRAAQYRHSDYNEIDANYSYGQSWEIYITQTEDGNRPSMANLSGEEATNLMYDTDIMEALSNYDDQTIWDLFLEQLTQSEVKTLIGSGGFMTSALYSLGKPRCTDKDGPAGYNDNVTNAGQSSVYTLYPSESLLGCCFSKETAYSIGEAQGKIGQEFGINGWYGPGVNLHRTPFTSRNYEYYSEDAVLSGLLAAETIKGAKDNHVYCYLKHMAVSEAGINPKDVNTWLTEQALREIYLRPFEIAVKKGGANAIMSAFNRVGAVTSGYNKAMLTDVLRTEWGFKGSVITDWFMGSGYMENYELGVLAGNDLWLSGTTGEEARLDLSKDEVAYAARESAKHILYTYIDTNIGNDSIKINAEAKSGLVIAIWTLVNVALGLLILMCIWFILISIPPIRRSIPFLNNKDTRRKEAYAAANGETVNADADLASGEATAEPVADQNAEEPETPDPADKA
ncbi:MAG: glycoside hydrolase family 3 C-terminal domain-containing protein, partial [Clostridiales bacterium]|nr:glycoside hydrolase family 3 C-terminal domain-containing protein [Clostridiales bacterium]